MQTDTPTKDPVGVGLSEVAECCLPMTACDLCVALSPDVQQFAA